mmetsp:Transcript_34068/g.63167  ORF Transcript_34068/g.63167 Transcript_34068/m.63167 type:complete len:215 (+) Transcript_34068:579-1223(+)
MLAPLPLNFGTVGTSIRMCMHACTVPTDRRLHPREIIALPALSRSSVVTLEVEEVPESHPADIAVVECHLCIARHNLRLVFQGPASVGFVLAPFIDASSSGFRDDKRLSRVLFTNAVGEFGPGFIWRAEVPSGSVPGRVAVEGYKTHVCKALIAPALVRRVSLEAARVQSPGLLGTGVVARARTGVIGRPLVEPRPGEDRRVVDRRADHLLQLF